MQTTKRQIFGQLITIAPEMNGQFLIKPLTQSHVERDFAQTIAGQAAHIELGGARQSLFVHDGGTLELWEFGAMEKARELLESLEEISRDAWSGERDRMNGIGRTADRLIAITKATGGAR